MTSKIGDVLFSIRDLYKHFPIRRGVLRREVAAIRAVDGISFEIHKGETLGLVGESGSGKSTTGRVILALDEPSGGHISFEGSDLAKMTARELRRARQRMQVVFQDPYASLNPRMRIGKAIREPLDIHNIGVPKDRDKRVCELLEMVGLDSSHATRFPREFSGGQRQRIGIARALATNPSFIVADEPISALDVSIQAQIVNLLADLKEKLGLTYLFIAHDLSMVRHLSDRVGVMYLGRIVEMGRSDDVFTRPLHPYTRALIDSMPVPDPALASGTSTLPPRGEIPDPSAPPAGCNFRPRCPLATSLCQQEEPALRAIGPKGEIRQVACHHAESIEQLAADKGQIE